MSRLDSVEDDAEPEEPGLRSGDELLRVLGALSNPHRLRIVAAVHAGTTYVSQLARDLGIGRPLLHMHLQRLEAGLVSGRMEVSDFGVTLDSRTIAGLADSITDIRRTSEGDS